MKTYYRLKSRFDETWYVQQCETFYDDTIYCLSNSGTPALFETKKAAIQSKRAFPDNTLVMEAVSL